MKSNKIPPTTVARLPLYLRCLESARSKQINSISSFELAELTGHNAAQLRKDLSYLGEFGTRGVGYEVDELIGQISKWLGIVKTRPVIVVGMGRLGQALCNYSGFSDKGFRIHAVHDVDPNKIGMTVAGLKVKHIDELQSEDGVIGIIATSAEGAQMAADLLIKAGVKAILNFAPATLDVQQGTCLRNVDFSSELQIMGFHLSSAEIGFPSDCCP